MLIWAVISEGFPISERLIENLPFAAILLLVLWGVWKILQQFSTSMVQHLNAVDEHLKATTLSMTQYAKTLEVIDRRMESIERKVDVLIQSNGK